MIQINIHGRERADADDALEREFTGWDETLTPQEVYEAARGCWKLAERADTEKFAVVVHGGVVRGVLEIDRVVPTKDGKRALEGHPVGAGHPFYDRWYGQAAPSTRGGGAITYIDDTTQPG